MSAHVPGPWRDYGFHAGTNGGERIVADERGEKLGYAVAVAVALPCGVPDSYPGTTMANARLIAAAPELLEALTNLLAKVHCGTALECELRDPATSAGAIAITRRQDLDADEVKEHLRNGKQVFRLGLVFDDRLSFVLGEDLIVRKLKFLDVVQDALGDSMDYDSAKAEADASFTLLTLELQRLLAKLSEWFGLPRPSEG